MNTLKQLLVVWGTIFPFHTLMQEKTVAKRFEFNNNMYIYECEFVNNFFSNLHRVISRNHKYTVQSNSSQTELFLQNNNTCVLSNVGPFQAVSLKLYIEKTSDHTAIQGLS